MATRIDVLLKLYDEHAAQARRHEEHRERMTNIVLVLSGALIALIGTTGFGIYALPAAIVLILLGVYGWIFAQKHYERNKYHTSVMSEIHTELDLELGVTPWPGTGQPSPRKLSQIRNDGASTHFKNFPWPTGAGQKSAKAWIARRRLHHFWEALHLIVVLLGLILAGVIVARLAIPPEQKPLEVKLVQ